MLNTFQKERVQFCQKCQQRICPVINTRERDPCIVSIVSDDFRLVAARIGKIQIDFRVLFNCAANPTILNAS